MSPAKMVTARKTPEPRPTTVFWPTPGSAEDVADAVAVATAVAVADV